MDGPSMLRRQLDLAREQRFRKCNACLAENPKAATFSFLILVWWQNVLLASPSIPRGEGRTPIGHVFDLFMALQVECKSHTHTLDLISHVWFWTRPRCYENFKEIHRLLVAGEFSNHLVRASFSKKRKCFSLNRWKSESRA